MTRSKAIGYHIVTDQRDDRNHYPGIHHEPNDSSQRTGVLTPRSRSQIPQVGPPCSSRQSLAK
jgi:hypothetical protein